MLSLPTRAEYSAALKSMNHPEMDTDSLYGCYCEIIEKVNAMHDRFPERSYASLAREYIQWIKDHR